MQPETGDRNVHVTAQDVTAALHEVGVTEGDTVMFHSSLSSMGTVDGGPDTVIEGFLDAVGPTGTVAVPTLCNWQPGEQHLVFGMWDKTRSPSYVGAITQAFRQRPDALRSDHATHSVAAIGARAAELTEGHGAGGLRLGPFGPKAFAAESPWERLRLWDAAYCFLGVTFYVNTMVHYVETLVVDRALQRAPEDRREGLAAQVEGWRKPGVWPRIAIADRELFEERLAQNGLVRYAKVGSATLRCARAASMIDEWLKLVESDPARWLPEGFQQWYAEAQQ